MINGFKYYDTATQKQGKIEFYNYYDHLKNFGIRLKKIAVTNSLLQIIYEKTLSADEKTISKKFTLDAYRRYQMCLNESRMIYCTRDFQQIISVTSEYAHDFTPPPVEGILERLLSLGITTGSNITGKPTANI